MTRAKIEVHRFFLGWENTLYIIVLTIVREMAMDSLSSWLRRWLIHGRDR